MKNCVKIMNNETDEYISLNFPMLSDVKIKRSIFIRSQIL